MESKCVPTYVSTRALDMFDVYRFPATDRRLRRVELYSHVGSRVWVLV